MHRQTTKHIRHTKGTHFSGGLVIILLAGVGSHENSTLLFPVGCEFTSKVRPYSTPRAWRNAPIDFSHVIETDVRTDVRTDVLFAHALPITTYFSPGTVARLVLWFNNEIER